MNIVVPIVLNFEPHFLLLTFEDSPYRYITARRLLDKVREACKVHYHLSSSFPPTWWSATAQLQLRYVPDSALAFNRKLWLNQEDRDGLAARLGVNSVESLDPSKIEQDQAVLWYRTIGYHMSSEAVHPEKYLWSKIPKHDSDAKLVRWYVLVDVSIESQLLWPSFVPKSNDLAHDRKKYIQAIREELRNRSVNGVKSPSVVSRSPNLFRAAQASSTPVSMGFRPYDDYGPLPPLFCPPLAYAYNRKTDRYCDVSIELAVNQQDPEGFIGVDVWLDQFSRTCCDSFKTERELVAAIQPMIAQLIADPGLQEHSWFRDAIGPVFELDCAAECRTAHGLPAVYFALEAKRGPNGDALVQAILAIKRMLGLDRFAMLARMCFCPVLVMTVEARSISINLVYFTDKVYAMQLDSHTFAGNIDSAKQLETLQPIYQVLRNTAAMLREWYANIHTGTALPQAPFLYPQPSAIAHHLSSQPTASPQSFKTSCEIMALNLTFIDKISPDSNALRVLYKGMMVRGGKPPTPVYIKFVGRVYGERPHELLAAESLAPALYFCGEVLYGVMMIVMQDLGGESLPDVYPKKYRPVVERDIGAAKTLLHKNRLVHGDMRPPNVVYVPNGGVDGARAYLIDFDWSGGAGVTKYPTSLNPRVKWPKPVPLLQGRYIEMEHDDDMFENLLSSANSGPAAKKLKLDEGTQMGSSNAHVSGNPGNARNSTNNRTGSTGAGHTHRGSGARASGGARGNARSSHGRDSSARARNSHPSPPLTSRSS